MENVNLDEKLLDWFNNYQKRKEEGTILTKHDWIPGALLTMYCQNPGKISFDDIYQSFKEKYVYNENEVEDVHNKEEHAGLGKVYDYIQSNEWRNLNSIYVLLILHQKLYSQMPNPAFGGKFRNVSAYLSKSDITTCEPVQIPRAVAELDKEYQELDRLAKEINEEGNYFDLTDYIDRCVALKTKLVHIHPFPDGNGRSCRALLNILFKKVQLPPVYVQPEEKKEYIIAMDKAIRKEDHSAINHFYYYKICESIVELDIKERKNKEDKSENTLQK